MCNVDSPSENETDIYKKTTGLFWKWNRFSPFTKFLLWKSLSDLDRFQLKKIMLIKMNNFSFDVILSLHKRLNVWRNNNYNNFHCITGRFFDFSVRLAKLIENQPKKNKKSVRCLLHSLDSQRSRPLTPVWRDVWDCMKPDCKKDVCIIEASSLYATLETYLRKHRFCAECRTKVLKGKNKTTLYLL